MEILDQEEKHPVSQAEFLGELLIQQECIVPQDLEFALEHQRHTREPLGEILVRMGALNPDELARTLSLHGETLIQ